VTPLHYVKSLCVLKKCYFDRLKINNITTLNVCAFITRVFGTGSNHKSCTDFQRKWEIINTDVSKT
jgi:hypothetical protein